MSSFKAVPVISVSSTTVLKSQKYLTSNFMLNQTKQKILKVESNTESKPVSPSEEKSSSITQCPAWCSLCVEGAGEG